MDKTGVLRCGVVQMLSIKVPFLHVFDVFLDLVILVYFDAISIDFYSVKNFICINFV